jgi:Thrombospondin type 3 repeat
VLGKEDTLLAATGGSFRVFPVSWEPTRRRQSSSNLINFACAPPRRTPSSSLDRLHPPEENVSMPQWLAPKTFAAAFVSTLAIACGSITTSPGTGGGNDNGGGGGSCPCTVGNSGISFTYGCGQRGCYELNGTSYGVYCTQDGPQDDPSACDTTGTDAGSTPDAGAPLDAPAPSAWPDARGLCNPAGPDAPDPRGTDCDGDGVADSIDNCPGVPNPDQADTSKKGVGDACLTAWANCQLFHQVPFVPQSYAGMDLRGCLIDGTLATPSGDGGAALDFRGADLTCAAMQATGTWNADFTNATMSQFNAYVNVSGAGPTFTGAQLGTSCFNGIAEVTFDTTNLEGAWIRLVPPGTTGCSFVGANLTNATLDQMISVSLNGGTVTGLACVETELACASGVMGTASASCATEIAQATSCP